MNDTQRLDTLTPLAGFAPSQRRRIVAVLTDIDDTLTDNGRLPALSYAAMERLHEAGVLVVPVTGRPAGWCDLIARQWPVDAVVGENGALYFRYDGNAKRMRRFYAKPPAERRADRMRLEKIRDEVLREVAGAAISADQPYREADLAVDFSEDVPPLGKADIAKIAAIFERHGATAKISSIHVNGWFGGYDKLTTSAILLKQEFGIDPDARRDEIIFAGDSPNDAPMFAYFPNSVGVANVLGFASELTARPRWITAGRSAEGFAELAECLIAARSFADRSGSAGGIT